MHFNIFKKNKLPKKNEVWCDETGLEVAAHKSCYNALLKKIAQTPSLYRTRLTDNIIDKNEDIITFELLEATPNIIRKEEFDGFLKKEGLQIVDTLKKSESNKVCTFEKHEDVPGYFVAWKDSAQCIGKQKMNLRAVMNKLISECRSKYNEFPEQLFCANINPPTVDDIVYTCICVYDTSINPEKCLKDLLSGVKIIMRDFRDFKISK